MVKLTASAGRLFMAHVRAKEIKNNCSLHVVNIRQVGRDSQCFTSYSLIREADIHAQRHTSPRTGLSMRGKLE